MKKRIVATLLVGAVATAGIAGLTACGNKSVSLPKGEEVTAEKWVEACTGLGYLKLESYTYTSSATAQSTVTGTEKYNGKKTYDANATAKATNYRTVLADVKNNTAYTESNVNMSVKGTSLEQDFNLSYKTSNKSYYELKEDEDENKGIIKTYWEADYSTLEAKSDDGRTSEEGKWTAEDTTYFVEGDTSFLGTVFYDKQDVEKAENVGPLAALYKSFEYADGVYTANLYTATYFNLTDESYRSDIVACEVKVSISEGIVIGYSLKIDTEGTLKDKAIDEIDHAPVEVEFDYNYTVKSETVIALTEVNGTDVSKKVNKDITNAIDKAKAEEKVKKDIKGDE